MKYEIERKLLVASYGWKRATYGNHALRDRLIRLSDGSNIQVSLEVYKPLMWPMSEIRPLTENDAKVDDPVSARAVRQRLLPG